MQLDSLPAAKTSRLVQKRPFFYRWVVWVVGTLGIIMTSPGQTYAVSIFIEHFIADLGLSRSLARLLGQGSLRLVSQNVINQWWQQQRGTMRGLSSVASSLY